MKRIFFFLLTMNLARFCVAQTSTIKLTLISEHKNGKDIFLNYEDKFNDVKFVRFDPDYATGLLPNRLVSLSYPVLLKFTSSTGQYPVFARPGDTILVNTASSSQDYYRFSNSRHNTTEKEFFTNLEKEGLGVGYPDSYGISLAQATCIRYAEAVHQKYLRRLAVLEATQKSASLPKDFCRYARSYFTSKYLHGLFVPYWRNPHIYATFPVQYVALLHKSGVRRALTSDTLVATSDIYRVAAMSYTRFLSRDSLDTPHEFQVSYRNAADSLQGKTRDYVLFALMKSNINHGSNDFKRVYNQFKATCTSKEYVEYVDSLLARNTKLLLDDKLAATTLESSSGEKLTWRELLSKNKANVLYLDLWASWCIPCLREMPESKKMQEALRGEPVKFIYITIDTNRAKWLKSIEANGLNMPGVQHYRLDAESALAVYLQVPPVPHYLLLDQQGMPITLNAARPGDSRALSAITQLLR